MTLENVKTVFQPFSSYISNTNSSVSLRFQTTRKLLKHEGLRAQVFYCFRVVCHGNETRRMSVWNNFSNELSFDKTPVGINTLNSILPDMCAAVGLKRKTAHCLRVTCASSLFNANVDSKLIRERTGHRSDALLK